ncbi:MAG: hypothetical protein WA021_02320 [Minisyncoccia bacterium]
MKTTTKATLGAAAATGAAMAAAYYLYGSENATEHRRKLKQWAHNAEREIIREAKKLKNKALTDQNVRALITEAAARYKLTKELDSKEVRDFIAGMQKRWTAVRKTLTSVGVKPARGKQRKVRATKATRS